MACSRAASARVGAWGRFCARHGFICRCWDRWPCRSCHWRLDMPHARWDGKGRRPSRSLVRVREVEEGWSWARGLAGWLRSRPASGPAAGADVQLDCARLSRLGPSRLGLLWAQIGPVVWVMKSLLKWTWFGPKAVGPMGFGL